MPVSKKRTVFPEIGAKLVGRSRGRTYEATVVGVRRNVGRVEIEMGGRRYSSLSAAAREVLGHQTNGWVFWGLD